MDPVLLPDWNNTKRGLDEQKDFAAEKIINEPRKAEILLSQGTITALHILDM